MTTVTYEFGNDSSVYIGGLLGTNGTALPTFDSAVWSNVVLGSAGGGFLRFTTLKFSPDDFSGVLSATTIMN